MQMDDTSPEEIDANQILITDLLIYQKACREGLKESANPRPTSSTSSLGTDSNTIVAVPHSLSKLDISNLRTHPFSDSNSPQGNLLVEDHIGVELRKWQRLFQGKLTQSKDQRERIRLILQYFIDVAARNDLGGSSAVQILGNCLNELAAHPHNTGGDRTAATSLWEQRIGQRKIEEVEQDLGCQCRESGDDPEINWEGSGEVGHRMKSNLVLSPNNLQSTTSLIDEIPLFNLWDSLSFIYTKAVEPITDRLHAELHLYQFWTIICILRDCEKHFIPFATPTTAAATWRKPPETGQSYIIAFATTCVGPRLKSLRAEARGPKQNMQKLRRRHIDQLKTKLGITDLSVKYPNLDGNCPEYISWSVVGGPGSYFSHCLGRKLENVKSLKFCPSCSSQAGLLAAHRIEMIDLWKSGTLVDTENPENEEHGKFPFCYMKRVEDVIKRSIQGGYEEDNSYPDYTVHLDIPSL